MKVSLSDPVVVEGHATARHFLAAMPDEDYVVVTDGIRSAPIYLLFLRDAGDVLFCGSFDVPADAHHEAAVVIAEEKEV